METNFNFKSQPATSREQSKRLLALGLKKETADCIWIELSEDNWKLNADGWKTYYSIVEEGFIPAWSLGRLLELAYGSWEENLAPIYLGYHFDMLIKRIDYQIKKGIFNKEYLV